MSNLPKAPVAKYRERSNHDVHRGAESQPCFCWAETDHRIGQEVAAPPADEVLRKRIRQLEVLLDRCRDHVRGSLEVMVDYDDAEEDAAVANELLEDLDVALAKEKGDEGK